MTGGISTVSADGENVLHSFSPVGNMSERHAVVSVGLQVKLCLVDWQRRSTWTASGSSVSGFFGCCCFFFYFFIPLFTCPFFSCYVFVCFILELTMFLEAHFSHFLCPSSPNFSSFILILFHPLPSLSIALSLCRWGGLEEKKNLKEKMKERRLCFFYAPRAFPRTRRGLDLSGN